MKTYALPALACLGLMGCMSDQTGTNTQAPEYEKVTWEEAKALVTTCKVETAYQAHSGGVWLTLKDGTTVETATPALDEIVHVAGDSPECGELPVIME